MSNSRDTVTNPWTKEEIVKILQTNPMAVRRAMVRLLERQTADERAAHTTKHSNGRGFSAFHARTGTKLGKYAQAGGTFGPPWHRSALKIAIIHSGQLVDIANGVE